MRNLIASDPFGKIEAPEQISEGYGLIGSSGGGLTAFIANVIILFMIMGGIWALFNILQAGFSLISSGGDSKKLGEMSEKITATFIGLLVMVSAPLLAALIGLFLFGNATYFLRPTIFGIGEL